MPQISSNARRPAGSRTASVLGDPTLLLQLVENLIDNGVRYNRTGGELVAASGSDDRWATLTIENDGAELSDADVAHLTEPFARGPEGSPDDQSGLGLGLTLAESIAQAHGGTIELGARPMGGLRVVVRLPATDATAEGSAHVPSGLSEDAARLQPQSTRRKDGRGR